MLPEELLRAVRAHLARDTVDYAEPPQLLSGGFFTENHAFRLAGAPLGWDGPLVVRLFPDTAPPDLAFREASVQTELVAQEFPAAPVVWFDERARLCGRRCFVMQRLPGRALVGGIEPRDLLRAVRFGRRLPEITASVQVQLHRLDATALADQIGEASDGIARSLSALERVVDDGAGGFADALRWLGDHRPAVSSARVVCHGDLWGGKILVDGRGVPTGVLDWTTSSIGPPVLDVGATALAFCLIPLPMPGPVRAVVQRRGRNLYERYVRTYRQRSDADLGARPYFEALRCAAELSWVADWRLAEMAGEHDGVRPAWDVIAGELVEFFRRRTGVTISLPEPAPSR